MLLPTNKNSQGHLSRFGSFIMLFVWLSVLAALAVNRQNISDWWKLRDYQAPAAQAALADQVTMTPLARKVFYVNDPQLA